MQNLAPSTILWCQAEVIAESLIKNLYINILSLKSRKFKKIEKMDDFSFEDAGDQLDDDITEAIRLSLAEATDQTVPSPHFATKTFNQGKYVRIYNFWRSENLESKL